MNLEEKYEKLISFFKDISAVPRNSKEEAKIAEFLCDFAKNRKLEWYKDDCNNVIIKKKASPGYEKRKTILFQAHTDMVCEKNANSEHDFSKDGIDIIENKGTFTAKDTTLGADDGIGVALLLLMLDDEEIKHPDIECLFTTQEEIGMYGAKFFNYDKINASYLINLDGEEENTAIVGCAGGVSVHYTKEYKSDVINEKVYEIEISGLYGGHSGVDIDKGRINSNYLMAKILSNIEDIKLVSFVGGNKDNAIANYTKSKFATNSTNLQKIIDDTVSKFNITDADKNLKIVLNLKEEKDISCISNLESKNILYLLTNLKQGVIEYSKDMDGLVETSGNIGIVKVEKNKALIVESLRSSIDNKKEVVKEENNSIAKNLEFNIEEEGEYPGWKYNPNSKLQNVYYNAYKSVHNNEEPIICAIHAGVECGIIYEKLPHLDMISLGPDVVDVHTTNETLYLDSCKKILKTLINMIENLD